MTHPGGGSTDGGVTGPGRAVLEADAFTSLSDLLIAEMLLKGYQPDQLDRLGHPLLEAPMIRIGGGGNSGDMPTTPTPVGPGKA